MSRRYTVVGYLTGAFLARTGDELSGPALLLTGLAATGSPAVAATLLAGLTVSAALGGPLLGAMLDGSRRPGRLLALVLAGYAAGLALILGTLGWAPTAVVAGLALLTGLANPAVAGGWTSQLPDLAGPVDTQRRFAWDAMTFSAAALLGPGLAGAIAALADAGAALALAAVTVALAVPAAWLLPDRAHAPAQAPVLSRLRAGFAVVAGNPALRRATVTSMASYAGIGAMIACLPLFGEQRLGDAGHGALVLAALAAASLSTNALLARYPLPCSPDRRVLLSTVVLSAGTALLAVTDGPAWVAVAAVLLGVGEGPQLTALFAVRHREAPQRLRAQVFTTGASLKITAFALGTALGGAVIEESPLPALLLALGWHVAAATLYAVLPARPRTPVPARAV